MSDGWDRLWERDRDQDVGLSSTYLDMINVFGAEIGGMKDPRDTPPTYVWNLPRRAFSLKTESGFIGFAVPGVQPIGVTRLSMKNRRFSLSFEPVRLACCKGVTPTVYIVPGLEGAYDVLDEYRVLTQKLGLIEGAPIYDDSIRFVRIFDESSGSMQVIRKDGLKCDYVADDDYMTLVTTLFAALRDHLQQRGWADRYWQHIFDEPAGEAVANYLRLARTLREIWPQARFIDAADADPALFEAIDVLVPLIDHRTIFDEADRVADAGRTLWCYTSNFPRGAFPPPTSTCRCSKRASCHGSCGATA
jgi:hypothetical protein